MVVNALNKELRALEFMTAALTNLPSPDATSRYLEFASALRIRSKTMCHDALTSLI